MTREFVVDSCDFQIHMEAGGAGISDILLKPLNAHIEEEKKGEEKEPDTQIDFSKYDTDYYDKKCGDFYRENAKPVPEDMDR